MLMDRRFAERKVNKSEEADKAAMRAHFCGDKPKVQESALDVLESRRVHEVAVKRERVEQEHAPIPIFKRAKVFSQLVAQQGAASIWRTKMSHRTLNHLKPLALRQ